MNIIEIKNLNFSYKDKKIFDNFNLKIKKNTWNSIIGANGSGKTTLIKIITGLIESDSIYIDGVNLNNDTKYELRKKIACIFENVENGLFCETVLEELMFVLDNFSIDNKEIRINNILNLFNFENINSLISDLSLDEKQTLAIMSGLIIGPKILILDEALTYLNKKSKIKILNILKKLDITVISITHDVEELLYADNIIVLSDGKVEIMGTLEELFNKDELSDYPFIVNLSKKLKYYDLVNDISYTYKELVDKIWLS